MHQRSLKFILLLLFILLPSLINAGANISNFHARSENGSILLFWDTLSESNVAQFDIFRSTDNGLNFFKIDYVKSRVGNSSAVQSYSYTDNSILKSTTSAYQYRLEIIDQNGQSQQYSVVVTVDGPSGIRRTWGSLKAMFR